MSLLPEPPELLTAACNSATAIGHLVMAVMAWWYASARCRRRDTALAGFALVAGAVMHLLGGAGDLPDARWTMIARTFCGPLIVWGWYRLLRAVAACDAKQTRTERLLKEAAAGPNTQRLIDARVLLERIEVPTPMRG